MENWESIKEQVYKTTYGFSEFFDYSYAILYDRDGKLYNRYNDQFLTEDVVFDLCLDEAMERTEKDIKNEMKELEETEEWGKINDDAAENH